MKYRKKPIIVDAFKWTGGQDQTEDPEWIADALKKGIKEINGAEFCKNESEARVWIGINGEGNVRYWAVSGDFILRDSGGHLSSMKPDTFEATYEKA